MDWSWRKLRLDWCWSSQVVIEGVRNTEFDCWLSPVPSPRPSLENFNFVTNRIEQLTICTGGNRRNWRPWNILLSNWEENLDLKIFTNFADGLKALNRISFKVKGKNIIAFIHFLLICRIGSCAQGALKVLWCMQILNRDWSCVNMSWN